MKISHRRFIALFSLLFCLGVSTAHAVVDTGRRGTIQRPITSFFEEEVMQTFSGDSYAERAIRCCMSAAESTGQKHSVIAVSDSELAVMLTTEAGARAIETIRPVGQKRRW